MTNPVFHYLLDRYKGLRDQGMDNTLEARTLFIEMMHYAPPECQKVADDLAHEMDLIPEVTGYLDDGTPMVSLEAMAKKLGMTIEDAEKELEQFIAMRKSLGLPLDGIITDSSRVHRVQ